MKRCPKICSRTDKPLTTVRSCCRRTGQVGISIGTENSGIESVCYDRESGRGRQPCSTTRARSERDRRDSERRWTTSCNCMGRMSGNVITSVYIVVSEDVYFITIGCILEDDAIIFGCISSSRKKRCRCIDAIRHISRSDEDIIIMADRKDYDIATSIYECL
jgi:hypothetical protein